MNRAYIPVLVGLAMAIGVWLGSGLTNPFARPEQSANWNKIEQILQYVSSDYVDTISRKQLEEEVVAFLMQRLDPHSHYIPEQDLARINEPLEGNFDGIGIQFNLRNDTIYVVSTIKNGPSERAGIHPGDLIVTVDGDTVAGTGLSNSTVTQLLKGPKGSKVKVGVQRLGIAGLKPVTVERGEIPIKSIEAAYLINDSTIFVRLARFSKHTHEEFKEEVYPLKGPGVNGMVLDLRGNGGGYLDGAINLADEFLEKGQLITYTEGRTRPRLEYRSSSDGIFEDLRLSIIIDGFSASASEILAGCVQDLGRGAVVGSRSFGKGLVQEQNEWTDGSATRLTVARYYTPNGRSIQRPYNEQGNYELNLSDSVLGGIIPDIEVKRDTSGITWLYAEAVHMGLLTRFAYHFRDIQMERFLSYTEEEFIHELTEEEIKTALYDYLKADMGELNEREWKRSSSRMAQRVRAVIGRSLFSEETYFRVHNTSDNFVETAIKSLKTANPKAS